jgi:hypothetical protein
MAVAARKEKPKTVRDLCRELLEIERDNPEIFARAGEIKTLLKATADSQGKFREAFTEAGLVGWVSVSPGKAESVIGEGPEIVVEGWSKLKQPRQDKLIADGLVRIVPLVKGASYGQVRTKLDTPTQGASK